MKINLIRNSYSQVYGRHIGGNKKARAKLIGSLGLTPRIHEQQQIKLHINTKPMQRFLYKMLNIPTDNIVVKAKGTLNSKSYNKMYKTTYIKNLSYKEFSTNTQKKLIDPINNLANNLFQTNFAKSNPPYKTSSRVSLLSKP